MFFDNLPTTDGNIIGAGGIYNSAIEGNFTPANAICSLSVMRQNDACVWSLYYVDNMSVHCVNSTQTVQPQRWYLVELKAVQGAGNGEVHLYLNDVETLNAAALTNNKNSGIDHVSIGGGITADQPITWYCAGAIAATGYVGPQTQTDNIATATGQALAPSILCFAVTASFFASKYFVVFQGKKRIGQLQTPIFFPR